MSGKLFDISGKIDQPRLEIFRAINDAANKVNAAFFIVGATARDIILEQIYSKKVYRATNDIDLGIRVNTWEDYEKITAELTKNTKIKADERVEHRFLYNGVYPIDIVPFGKIASAHGKFKWPQSDNEFTILGFDEAYENSDQVLLSNDPELIISFASPESLAMLKIISWDERYPGRSRDATDLVLLIETYIEAGNEDRLANEESDLLKDFDFTMTGARLMGRDIARTANEQTITYLLNILNNETGEQKEYRLVTDMMSEERIQEDAKFEKYMSMLENLKAGILDKHKLK